MTIALLFPGQGSQHPGMGESWRETPSFDLAVRARARTGIDVPHLLLHADADELVRPQAAQLSIFVHSCMVVDRLRDAGALDDGPITAAAGHSLGEYSALVAAGVLTFDDGVRLVSERGAAMAAAAALRPGAMLAVVGLPPDRLAELCAAQPDWWPANENAPEQIVVSGAAETAGAMAERCRAAGARIVRPLAVGGAYHTPLMAPAAARLDRALAATGFADAVLAVVCNVDAAVHRAAADFRPLLSAQLTGRVRWTAALHTLTGLGVTDMVETGPGRTLTGLARRTVPGVATRLCPTPEQADLLVTSARETV
ncbi:ACP S-malonyltransferase [Nocardia sp. alder85J]|uniref:ACP S-malonyltransferase n=1 Tax=Nocardia sp. alder85J TaxID=2862949 RepID=UPI001CD1EBEE|nr:ACP S-malonyltransferase [Nocardia sp. alder85J]MCX4097501.1 ACP S-malonyltransferase [Nocardia sp. alder85J]